jgi:hypothetical protein
MMNRFFVVFFVTLGCFLPNAFATAINYSQGQCITLPTLFRKANPCAGTVNYPFYLAPGQSIATLTVASQQALNNTALLQFSSPCLKKIIAYKCSKIYLKCHTNVVLSDTTTYNTLIYPPMADNYPVPFQKPCLSVCTDLLTSCPMASLYVPLFGNPNCANALYDYSAGNVVTLPNRFDTSNNAAQCFTLDNTNVPVGTATEQYIDHYAAPCSGYVGTFFVPPGNKLNAALTVTQPPGFIQGLINDQLESALQGASSLPPTCFNAVKKFLCYSTFLKPVQQTLNESLYNAGFGAQYTAINSQVPGLLANSFWIPQYPDVSVCQNYISSCPASAITSLSTVNSIFNPKQCNGTTSPLPGSPLTFPITTQVVASVSTPIGNLVFKSGPNSNLYNVAAEKNTVQSVGTTGMDFTTGKCVSLPTLSQYRYFNPCAGVVNYPFYLAPGESLDTLMAKAQHALNHTALSQLPSTCLSNVVSYQCSKIYLKCKSDVVISDKTTYNFAIYNQPDIATNFGLPFQRPCSTVCTDMATTCASSLYPVIFGTIDCNNRYDYSYGNVVGTALPYQFDISNNNAQCFKPQFLPVAAITEDYLIGPDAPCSGLVDTFLVPPGNKLLSTFTVLQSPYAEQQLMNTKINTVLQQAALFPPSCYNAVKQYACYTTFINPTSVSVSTALTNNGLSAFSTILASLYTGVLSKSLIVPQFPQQSVCTNFQTSCASVKSFILANNPSMWPNCSSFVTGSTTALSFPTTNQIVASVVAPFGTLSLSSGPNNNLYSNATEMNVDTVPVSPPGIDFTQGQCISLPATAEYRLVNPCAGVVNYPFYLAPGESLTTLATKAKNALNHTALQQLPSTCLSNVVSLQCSKIYLKCKSDVVISDKTTYNFALYATNGINVNFGVPFIRPCSSVCTDVVSSCAGSVYSAIFGTLDCATHKDYSYGNVIGKALPYRYDNTNSLLNCFVTQSKPVAGASEQYKNVDGAPCAGYVDTFLMPPGYKLDPSFTLLQAPGTIQNLINAKFSTAFSSLPAFLPTDCTYSLRQYLCYSTFIGTTSISINQALINNHLDIYTSFINANFPGLLSQSLTIPAFPPKSVCTNYAQACAVVVPQLAAKNPLLNPNCDQIVPGTPAKMFPTSVQAVASVTVPFGSLVLTSGPNANLYYNSSEEAYNAYEPSCPEGFVIPENPEHGDVKWVSGTACAMACR